MQTVDLDEVAHYEPPHQDLHCLQIQLFLSLVLRVQDQKLKIIVKFANSIDTDKTAHLELYCLPSSLLNS